MERTLTAAFTGFLFLIGATFGVGAETHELTWNLMAEVREARLQGEVLAGGRLRFVGSSSAEGDMTLRLSDVIEAPWKLYWIDPWGPFGEEVKVASVIDLEEGTWAALEVARRTAEESAQSRYAAWAAKRPAPPPLDGTFAFLVIGPATGRFVVNMEADGSPTEVSNRLTDHWLAGPFDQWVGRPWQSAEPGYWFWNATEEGPFDYEPHTYNAIAAALPMLTNPHQRGDELWAHNALTHALAALAVLVPRLASRAEVSGLPDHPMKVLPTQDPGTELFANRQGDTVERRTANPGGGQIVEVHLRREGLSYELRLELAEL